MDSEWCHPTEIVLSGQTRRLVSVRHCMELARSNSRPIVDYNRLPFSFAFQPLRCYV